ncbi:hypothetical protein GNF18_10235 [Ligilactobacillus pobuzihii]|uniref:hypothetical protein n=1 Tax=Ligilactobacillus pobuzihii TaxID=449659 RepID=UPI0019D3077A|nr:hypothetical protein [Ligilactobacillus pobuzihii]MBN7275518.1 hypothetical protein [Ligilactobacillus pobuzihii]
MFKEEDKRAFIKKLFDKLNEAYTQRSRTNNKLDKVIEQLNGLGYGRGKVTVENSTPFIQPEGIGDHKDKLQQDTHIPHIRIEFDDINDVPKVYIDGKDIADWGNNHSALQELHVDWLTDTDHKQPKSYEIQVLDDDGSHMFSNLSEHQVGDIVKLSYEYDESGKPHNCGEVMLTEDGWRAMNTNVYLPASEVHEHEV